MDDRQPLVPPSPPLPASRARRGLLVALATMALLLALAALLWLYPPLRSWIIAQFHPQVPQSVVMRGQAVTAYRISGKSLVAIAPTQAPTKSKFYVLETASTTPEGTLVIGGAAPDAAHIVALITKQDGLIPLALSLGQKRDLSLGTNGLAAFASLDAEASTSEPLAHVWVANPATYAGLADLGRGDDPVFAADQSLLAVAPEGLIAIDPVGKARAILLGAPYAGATGPSLISPDATYVILPNAVTHAEDVYRMNPKNPAMLSYTGSLPGTPLALGALDNATFLVETTPGTATAYAIRKSGLMKGAAYTLTN